MEGDEHITVIFTYSSKESTVRSHNIYEKIQGRSTFFMFILFFPLTFNKAKDKDITSKGGKMIKNLYVQKKVQNEFHRQQKPTRYTDELVVHMLLKQFGTKYLYQARCLMVNVFKWILWAVVSKRRVRLRLESTNTKVGIASPRAKK